MILMKLYCHLMAEIKKAIYSIKESGIIKE